jgi:hypothetical protein
MKMNRNMDSSFRGCLKSLKYRHPELDSGSSTLKHNTLKQIPNQVWNDVKLFRRANTTALAEEGSKKIKPKNATTR